MRQHQQISLDQYIADEGAAQTQGREIRRVGGYLSPLVFAFCEGVTSRDEPVFRLAELERYCLERFEQAAPGSAGRILRLLSEQGAISYSVVNRRSSLYRIEAVDRTKRPTNT